MVPAEKIIETAVAEKVDIIGLSGLITPSLEEMSSFAKEMQRRELDIPIMIGGATTSKMHTAVKIAPHYEHPVVYVPDASRSVSVASKLLSDDQKTAFFEDLKEDYAKVRERFTQQNEQRQLLSLEKARANSFKSDWTATPPAKPNMTGVEIIDDISFATLQPYIDWTPFFHTWQLKGKYPKILQDKKLGKQATELFADAQKMIQTFIDRPEIVAKGIVGIFPANTVNADDIEIYSHEKPTSIIATLPGAATANSSP